MSATTCQVTQQTQVQSSNTEVIQITKTKTVNNQQIFVIDEKAIESVFGEKKVKNCPVAIYSIAGKQRKGKSFFLTLFLNYLKEENWRRDSDKTISEGFSYCGGLNKHTEGIYVTKEPIFFTVHQKYEKVALYLMDTQGVFDSGSSDDSDSLLVSLSTVLSSYQIYNVKDNLDRNELKILKVYSDFGKTHFASGNSGETNSNQVLLFLIRDWYLEDHEAGFEGGKEYLKSIMNEEGASDAHKKLCKNIQKSFKEVKCALIPKPGEKITDLNKRDPCPKMKDAKTKFLDTLEEVFKTMIEPLEVKELNGNPLCGTDIMNLAINLSRKGQEGTLSAKVLSETHAAAYLANLLGRCEDDYDKMAKEAVREFVTDKAQLEEHHKRIVKEVVGSCNAVLESDDPSKNYKKTLTKILELRKFCMHQWNKVSEVGVEALYRYLVEDCYETSLDFFKTKYENCLQQKQMLSDEEVENEFNKTSVKILELFDRVPENEKLDEAIFNSYKDLLKEKLDLQKRVFIEENHFHQAKISALSYLQVCEKLNKWFSDTEQQWLENTFDEQRAMKIAQRFFDKKPIASDDWWTDFTNRLKPNTEKYTNLTQEMLEIYNKGQTNAVKKEIRNIESRVRQLNKNATIRGIQSFETFMEWKSISTSITDEDLVKSIAENCCARMKLEISIAQEENHTKTFLNTVEKVLNNFSPIHDQFAKKLMPKYLEEQSTPFWRKFFKASLDKIEDDIIGGLRNISNPHVDLRKILSSLKQVQEDYRSQNPEFWKKQAKRAKTLFLQEYNEEINWMLNRRMIISEDINKHFVEKLSKFKRYFESNYPPSIAALSSNELTDELSSLKCNWAKINTEHQVIFVRQFSMFDNLCHSLYWAFSHLKADNVQDKVVMYKPKSWFLPEKVGDTLTKFTKLKFA